VDQELVGVAFGAGLVAALNPCGFAMLPAYLAMVVRDDDPGASAATGKIPGASAATGKIPGASAATGKISAPLALIGRAVLATVAMAAGFVAVFSAFGLLTVSAASAVQRYLPYVTVAIGVVLLVLGAWLLRGHELSLALPLALGTRSAPTARLGSMFGYGISYALASLSCTVVPFLAVTAAGAQRGSVLDTLALYLAYSAGLALVVGSLAVAAALATSAVVDRIRRILPYVNRISGAILIVAGLYVSYYGVYEVRLFNASGNPLDPIIVAALHLQGTLAGWVYDHGPWPWLVLTAVLLVAATAWAWRRSARSRDDDATRKAPARADQATADGEP
jgi:cytochrome c biogenesis protein CcdA